MGGGLLTGLSNDDAARYAFLLATPIIGAAGRAEAARTCSARPATASAARRWSARSPPPSRTYVAVKFLLRFFETNRLTPFGIYCIVAGLTCTADLRLLALRR